MTAFLFQDMATGGEGARTKGAGEKGQRPVSGGSSRQAFRPGQGGSAPADLEPSEVATKSVRRTGLADVTAPRRARALTGAGAARLDLSQGHFGTRDRDELEARGQIRLEGF